MGRTRAPEFILILALLIKPSRPGFVSVTMPRGQEPLGIAWSLTSTISPFWRFLSIFSHFERLCNCGRYSFVHRRQKCDVTCWTCFHRFRYTSPNSKSLHGNGKLPFMSKKWLGVKACSSFASSLHFVIGRLFTIPSISQNKVLNTSSFMATLLALGRATMTLRNVRIIRSQMPP